MRLFAYISLLFGAVCATKWPEDTSANVDSAIDSAAPGDDTGDADTDTDSDSDSDSDGDSDTDTDTDSDTDTTTGDGWTLCINEFMASNASTYEDAGGAYPDWIELHNFGSEELDLEGVGITDNLDDPFKHTLEGLTLAAGGFVVLFADGDLDEGDDHLDFNLDIEGEALGLYGPGGAELDALEYNKQITDVAAYRTQDCGGEWSYTKAATPGDSNE